MAGIEALERTPAASLGVYQEDIGTANKALHDETQTCQAVPTQPRQRLPKYKTVFKFFDFQVLQNECLNASLRWSYKMVSSVFFFLIERFKARFWITYYINHMEYHLKNNGTNNQ